jgi:hypothetical protein
MSQAAASAISSGMPMRRKGVIPRALAEDGCKWVAVHVCLGSGRNRMTRILSEPTSVASPLVAA